MYHKLIFNLKKKNEYILTKLSWLHCNDKLFYFSIRHINMYFDIA